MPAGRGPLRKREAVSQLALAPKPAKQRRKGEERKRALERHAQELLRSQQPKRAYQVRSGVARGQPTELFLEWDAKPALVVVPKEVYAQQQSESEKRKRAKKGAAARWGPGASA